MTTADAALAQARLRRTREHSPSDDTGLETAISVAAGHRVRVALTRPPDDESAHPTNCGSGDPDAVYLHDLAVELDAPTETEVLDDVPVDRRHVRAADGVEARAEREVDGSVHLFVEVDVPHVAVDAGVAADPELADAARPFVGVECFDQEVFFAVS